MAKWASTPSSGDYIIELLDIMGGNNDAGRRYGHDANVSPNVIEEGATTYFEKNNDAHLRVFFETDAAKFPDFAFNAMLKSPGMECCPDSCTSFCVLNDGKEWQHTITLKVPHDSTLVNGG